MSYSDLCDEDINYLKSKFNENSNFGKYISLLLDKDGQNITTKDYRKFDLQFDLDTSSKYVLKRRLKDAFEKDGKGFFIDNDNKIKRNRENSFLNFFKQIEKFIEREQEIGRNKIKTIKIYDEYRSEDKESCMNHILEYFKQNSFHSKIIIKSIANDIKTKNFLIDISNTLSNVEIFIIKPQATRANASIYFVIIEINNKRSHLFYYDEELSYHEIDKQLDKNIKNLGLYGTIIKKFDKIENYEKFDSNADFRNISGNIIQLFDNILVNNGNFNSQKFEIKKNLEKIQLHFPDNVSSYHNLNVIMSFFEQHFDPLKQNNENEYVINQLKAKDIRTKIIQLLDETKSKV